ncbi:MAG: MBOAT family protein, partial [Clostridium sp.]|nr:MBOAT family protein [Clostridium sp.]
MVYTSFVFVIFLAVSGIIYYLIPKKAQWVVLLIASLVFYIMSSQLLTLIMLASTLTIYLGARLIQKSSDSFKAKKSELDKAERKLLKAKTKKKQKTILTVIVILNIAILAALKYCNFFGGIVNGIGSLFGDGSIIPVFKIILPLGISYYTLMSVSYIVDVYRGKIKAEVNPCRLLLYVCYFPHIMEGPFDRYDELDKQFREPHYLDYDIVKSGALLMMYGLFKKLVIADRAGLIAAGIFDSSESLSGTSVFIAVLMYTLQLYCDFSGCIEIVSGASEMFGIKIAK